MNAWHQACFRARQLDEEEPERELYEQRIKYTWPEDVGTLLTEKDRHEIRQRVSKLAAAAYPIELMLTAEQFPQTQVREVLALMTEVRSAMVLLRDLADAPIAPPEQ